MPQRTYRAIFLTALLLLMSYPTTGATPSSGEAASSLQPATNITATTEAQRVLDKATAAVGGRQRLLGVESLLVEGVRTIQSGTQYPFTYRMRLPDRFQVNDVITHTIDGPTFWQRPAGTEAARTRAERNIRARFAEQCLALLLRAPAVARQRASVVARSGDDPTAVQLEFSGPDEFHRVFLFDASTSAPRGFHHSGPLRMGEGTETVMRRVKFEEYRHVDGIRFPVKMSEAIGALHGTIELTRIRVNEPMPIELFKEP